MDFLVQAFLRRLEGYKDMINFSYAKTEDGSYIIDIKDISPSLDISLCNAYIEVPYTDEERDAIHKSKTAKPLVDKYESKQELIAIPIVSDKARIVRFILNQDDYAKKTIAIDSILRSYMETKYNKPDRAFR